MTKNKSRTANKKIAYAIPVYAVVVGLYCPFCKNAVVATHPKTLLKNREELPLVCTANNGVGCVKSQDYILKIPPLDK